MIVDDHQKFRETLKEILTPLKAEFCECTDGSEAVEKYPKVLPDLVLMDVKMKKMNGLEASQKIIAFDPLARIIVITNYKESLFEEILKRIGVIDYVLKENMFTLNDVITKSYK